MKYMISVLCLCVVLVSGCGDYSEGPHVEFCEGLSAKEACEAQGCDIMAAGTHGRLSQDSQSCRIVQSYSTMCFKPTVLRVPEYGDNAFTYWSRSASDGSKEVLIVNTHPGIIKGWEQHDGEESGACEPR